MATKGHLHVIRPSLPTLGWFGELTLFSVQPPAPVKVRPPKPLGGCNGTMVETTGEFSGLLRIVCGGVSYWIVFAQAFKGSVRRRKKQLKQLRCQLPILEFLQNRPLPLTFCSLARGRRSPNGRLLHSPQENIGRSGPLRTQTGDLNHRLGMGLKGDMENGPSS